MSEYAGKSHRGLLVSLVFAMQAAGLIVGPLLSAALLVSGLNHDLVWRILLGAGCVPALAVFQMRRHLAETPRFQAAQKRAGLAGADDGAGGGGAGARPDAGRPWSSAGPAPDRGPPKIGFSTLVRSRSFTTRLLGASLAWFLMDFAYYGNTVSSPLVLSAIAPKKDILSHTLMQLAVFVVAAAPGYLIAAAMMDRIGRKTIQILGFFMMAATFAAIALIPDIDKLVTPFLLVYGISYFFTEFGPNSTTFVYPAELFPVRGRTTGHGVAASAGKVGGFVGVFLFPILMARGGLVLAEGAAAVVSLLGVVTTVALLPETKGRTLEELNEEEEHDLEGASGLKPSPA